MMVNGKNILNENLKAKTDGMGTIIIKEELHDFVMLEFFCRKFETIRKGLSNRLYWFLTHKSSTVIFLKKLLLQILGKILVKSDF